jgi:uncharacterized LabA/DUF88 family protein
VIGSAVQRVVLFLDYQNVYHRAREAFCDGEVAAREGQVNPLALGHLLASRVPGGRLAGVRLYRGRPSKRRDPRSYAAFRRQTAKQVNRGNGMVTVVARDLRYLQDRPRRPAQENGIDVALAVDFVMMVARSECDVGILFSSDTELVPALEAGSRCGLATLSRATWPPGLLRVDAPEHSRSTPHASDVTCSVNLTAAQSRTPPTTPGPPERTGRRDPSKLSGGPHGRAPRRHLRLVRRADGPQA